MKLGLDLKNYKYNFNIVKPDLDIVVYLAYKFALALKENNYFYVYLGAVFWFLWLCPFRN